MKNRLLIISILITLYSCEYLDDRVLIINKTNKSLYYVLASKDSLNNIYYNTLSTDNQDDYSYHVKTIDSNLKSVEAILGAKNEWEKVVLYGDSQKLYIFIFNLDTLNKYNWRSIVEKEMYYKRISYRLEELKKNNWEILIR